MLTKFLYIGIFITFLFPLQSALASVFISEVMYDLPGNDNGGEWIELFNSGDWPVDLEGWNIETTANHRSFTLISGSFILPSGGFTLIVQDEAQKSQWPFLNLLGSSFSLNNTFGRIILKHGEEIIDTFSYTSEQGGAGDGNSLQKFKGIFVPFSPTAGTENLYVIPQMKAEPIISAIEKRSEAVVVGTRSQKELLEEIREEKTGESVQPVYNSAEETVSYNRSLVKWFLALGGILAFSSVGVFLLFRKDELDDIKIIEEE